MVLGAILTDKWIVQHLCPGIYLGDNSTFASADQLRASQYLYSIRLRFEDLRLWYSAVLKDTPKMGSDNSHPRFYPEPSAYPSASKTPLVSKPSPAPSTPSTAQPSLASEPSPALTQFKYKRVLRRDDRCRTFLVEVKSRAKIVVKFVERYGVDAHRILADAGYAPKLLHFGSAFPGIVGYKGAFMVVMEYVEGTNADSLTEDAYHGLRNAVDILHQAGFVHGDIRIPNVLLSRSGRVKIIDFDWAGKDGEVMYPSDLSMNINWHPDVLEQTKLVPIQQTHDQFMLQQLLPRRECTSHRDCVIGDHAAESCGSKQVSPTRERAWAGLCELMMPKEDYPFSLASTDSNVPHVATWKNKHL